MNESISSFSILAISAPGAASFIPFAKEAKHAASMRKRFQYGFHIVCIWSVLGPGGEEGDISWFADAWRDSGLNERLDEDGFGKAFISMSVVGIC